MTAIQHIYCVNCAATTSGTDWLGIATLVVASIAAVVSLVALFWTKDDRTLLREQHDASMREHDEFVKQLRAHADLTLLLRPLPVNPQMRDRLGVFAEPGVAMIQRIELAIDNRQGMKATGPTVVQVLVPADFLLSARWVNPDGQERTDRGQALATDERLVIEGREVAAQLLSLELSRVSIRVPRLVHFRCPIASNVTRFPIRIRVQADELADEVEAVVVDQMFEVFDPDQPDQLRGTLPTESPQY